MLLELLEVECIKGPALASTLTEAVGVCAAAEVVDDEMGAICFAPNVDVETPIRLMW